MSMPRRVNCSLWGWSATPAAIIVPLPSTPSPLSGSSLMMPRWKRWDEWYMTANFKKETRPFYKMYMCSYYCAISISTFPYRPIMAPSINCLESLGCWASMVVKSQHPPTPNCIVQRLWWEDGDSFTHLYSGESHRVSKNAVLCWVKELFSFIFRFIVASYLCVNPFIRSNFLLNIGFFPWCALSLGMVLQRLAGSVSIHQQLVLCVQSLPITSSPPPSLSRAEELQCLVVLETCQHFCVSPASSLLWLLMTVV